MDQKKTIAAVVVVYNTNCADSLTCRGLMNLDDKYMVVVYDNSTSDYGNREYCEKQGWRYLGGKGNVGLSKAYNACIDFLRVTKTADVVCIFDDDTNLDCGYFEALQKALEIGTGKIFVPLVYSNKKLISPCLLNPGHKIKLFENENAALTYSGSKITAINSCMAMDLSLFEDYRYDENIFLDGVDHTFIADMHKRGENVTVFSYHCKHSFSGDSVPTECSALSRFVIFERDFRYILRNDKLSYLRLVGKRMLRLSFQYRSLKFLKVIIKQNN